MPSQLIARHGPLGAAWRNPGKMSEALPSVAVVVNERPPATRRDTWCEFRRHVLAVAPSLSAPQPGAAGLCRVCRGPSRRSSVRCFQCELHRQCGGESLADVVLPAVFAPKGSLIARYLWQYKSPRPSDEAAAAGTVLLALLLVFLRDHGACGWRSAGFGGPSHVAVVPTGRGRPGAHPLRRLITPYLGWPWAELAARPDQRERDLDPGRFDAAPVPDARVLLVDDTWTTGASAQSAAMALRRAGASSVVTVVIGRRVGQPSLDLAAMPFRMESCAVHAPSADRRLASWLPLPLPGSSPTFRGPRWSGGPGG